jgi:hypothetical protein
MCDIPQRLWQDPHQLLVDFTGDGHGPKGAISRHESVQFPAEAFLNKFLPVRRLSRDQFRQISKTGPG